MSRLDRFKRAQDDPHAGFEQALEEIRAGRKRGHWIWYVFPQLDGLGMSSMARAYGLDGEAEATAYLRDRQLRGRLLTITHAAAEQLAAGRSASGGARRVEGGDGKLRLSALMGSEIDATKLVSSLTLFAEVARRLAGSAAADEEDAEAAEEYAAMASTAAEILTIASSQGYPPCAFTRRVLGMTD
jgi:uncharacterized protein (DUF1810 family)